MNSTNHTSRPSDTTLRAPSTIQSGSVTPPGTTQAHQTFKDFDWNSHIGSTDVWYFKSLIESLQKEGCTTEARLLETDNAARWQILKTVWSYHPEWPTMLCIRHVRSEKIADISSVMISVRQYSGEPESAQHIVAEFSPSLDENGQLKMRTYPREELDPPEVSLEKGNVPDLVDHSIASPPNGTQHTVNGKGSWGGRLKDRTRGKLTMIKGTLRKHV